jgi:hypothetical protein
MRASYDRMAMIQKRARKLFLVNLYVRLRLIAAAIILLRPLPSLSNGPASRHASSSILRLSLLVRVVFGLAAVYLMIGKPDAGESLLDQRRPAAPFRAIVRI